MYIGSGKMSNKEKERVFKLAKDNSVKGLQRSYDYYTSFFTALLITLLLFLFNIIKEMVTVIMTLNLLVINLTILIFIGVFFIVVANSRDDAFFAIKIRESNFINSRRKAFELIDSYSYKKK